MGRFVAYYRVSSQAQGASGLGLEAQQAAVKSYVDSVDGEIIAEFNEIESGANQERARLAHAIAHARTHRAVLVIAKLDRLARNVRFIANLLDSGLDFVVADMPHANRLTLHLISAVAEYEREIISARTRAALAAARRRGVKLGNPNIKEVAPLGSARAAQRANQFALDIAPIIRAMESQGVTTLSGIAAALNRQGIRTQRGRMWTPAGVSNVLKRLRQLEASQG